MASHESRQKDYMYWIDRIPNVSRFQFSSGYWCCSQRKENVGLSLMTFLIMSLLFSYLFKKFFIYFIIFYFIVSLPSAVRRPPSAVRRPPSAVRRPPSAVRRPPSAVRRPPSAVRRPPSAVRRPPSAVRRPPSAVRRPPSASAVRVLTLQSPYEGWELTPLVRAQWHMFFKKVWRFQCPQARKISSTTKIKPKWYMQLLNISKQRSAGLRKN